MKKIKSLSLFTGAGGLDIGFNEAGFEMLACVEINNAYVASLQKNREIGRYFSKSTNIHCADVRDFNAHDYAGLGIECVIGGPPCQTFSAAGRRSGGVLGTDDARGQLFQAYCDILKVIKPKVFVFENVYGLPGANDGGPWREIVEAFSSLGYLLTAEVVDTADYGVPQHRERLIMVGVQKGLSRFEFPMPTHGPDSASGKPLVSVAEAVGSLQSESEVIEPLGGLYGHLLEEVPNGLNYSFFTSEMGHPEPQFAWRSKFHDFLYKVDPTEPCRTIKAQPGKFTGPFHWKNRHFTVSELKRLQSFPDDYELVGTYGKIVEQIGNSVPPGLARVVATAVREQILAPTKEKQTFEIRKLGFASTFRQRQRERTLKFKAVAKEAIRKKFSNVVPIGRASNRVEEKIYSLEERFSLKEVDALSKAELGDRRLWAKFAQVGVDAMLDIKDLTLPKEPDVIIEFVISGLKKYIGHLDVLTVNAKMHNLQGLFNAWAVVQKTLISHSRFFTLIDIYGHYANRGDTVTISTRISGIKASPLTRTLEYFGNSSNCGVLVDWTTVARAINLDSDKLRALVRQLRELRFDVRSRDSHVTLREDGVLCTYPFPMLSGKAHFDSAITAWVV